MEWQNEKNRETHGRVKYQITKFSPPFTHIIKSFMLSWEDTTATLYSSQSSSFGLCPASQFSHSTTFNSYFPVITYTQDLFPFHFSTSLLVYGAQWLRVGLSTWSTRLGASSYSARRRKQSQLPEVILR